MASSRSPRALGEAFLAVAVSSVLFYFGLGLHPIWPLVWFAPLPLLIFALRGSWLAAGLTSVAAMMIGGVNMWGYLVTALGSPASVWFIVFLFAGIFFAGGVLLFRALVRRGALWSALVAFPAVYTTCEFLRNFLAPHGSAGSLAYSQLNFLPFLQLASITGPWGMTFVLLLLPAALAIAWHLRNSEPRRGRRVLGGTVALVAAILVFGFVRLSVPTGSTVRVGLIAHDQPNAKPVADPGAATEELFRAYADAAKKLAAEGAQAIVIPEKVAVTLDGKSAGSDAILQSLANETRATVVAGVVDVDGPVKYNQARIYTPDAAMQTYDKEHMLPPFESNLKPGTSLAFLHRAKQTWGVAICKDMDFSSPARRYGKAGAGLLLVPAWDFIMDGFYHGHIAVMRGVEDGFSVARTAKNGLLYASDSRGRILGETSSASTPFATLLVNVPVAHSWTAYQAWGDWFAWVAIVLLVVGVVQLLLRRG